MDKGLWSFHSYGSAKVYMERLKNLSTVLTESSCASRLLQMQWVPMLTLKSVGN